METTFSRDEAAGERPARRYRFPRRQRLSRNRDYRAVFDAGWRKGVGPLSVRARPNGRGDLRLGLTVPRRVGKATRRNRIKRLLREAFRLSSAEWPQGYDVVVVVRPHKPKSLDAYRSMLEKAITRLDERIRREREERAP